MDKAAFDEYVENRYKKQMAYYASASSKNQQRYKLFQWILIILSAVTPVLAAMNGFTFSNAADQVHSSGSQVLQILLVVVSSIVAILTSGLKTFQYQDLWINSRATYEQLKPEIYYYEFNIEPYAVSGVDKEALFVSRVEAILSAEHLQWPAVKKISGKSA